MSKNFDSGGYIGKSSEYLTRYPVMLGMSFVSSSSSVNSRSVVIPADAREGDLAVIADNINTAGTTSPPAGWTLIRSDSVSSNVTLTTYYKVLSASDPGSTVTSPDTSSTDHFLLCDIFRPRLGAGIDSVTVNSSSGEATTGNPSAKTSLMQGSTAPVLGMIIFAQRGSNNASLSISTTPQSDGDSTGLDESGRTVVKSYYKFYDIGETPANMSGNINDAGAQAIQAWHFTFTYKSGIKSYNQGVWSMKSVYDSKKSPNIIATGGNISDVVVGNKIYRVHSFSSPGTSTFTISDMPSGASIEYLLVGGGGGGASEFFNNAGGGGGAGGFRELVGGAALGANAVVVGAGGAFVNSRSAGQSGLASSFLGESAAGGGGGGHAPSEAKSGGSGGGGAGWFEAADTSGGSGNVPAVIPSQGSSGGSGVVNSTSTNRYSGGGGGASQAGANGSAGTRGIGGNGKASTITGTSVTYAGGGGGSRGSSNDVYSGGAGGGGNGGGAIGNAQAGTNGLGGGGGGSGVAQFTTAGGSGVVIIRYPLATPSVELSYDSQVSFASTSTTVFGPTIPDYVDDTYLGVLMEYTSSRNAGSSAPAGWTLAVSQPASFTTGSGMTIYYKILSVADRGTSPGAIYGGNQRDQLLVFKNNTGALRRVTHHNFSSSAVTGALSSPAPSFPLGASALPIHYFYNSTTSTPSVSASPGMVIVRSTANNFHGSQHQIYNNPESLQTQTTDATLAGTISQALGWLVVR